MYDRSFFQVIGAKVVTNANRPGAKCYGYVTMSSHEEASKCIQNLHRTELHGRVISVDHAKSDPATPSRLSANTSNLQFTSSVLTVSLTYLFFIKLLCLCYCHLYIFQVRRKNRKSKKMFHQQQKMVGSLNIVHLEFQSL